MQDAGHRVQVAGRNSVPTSRSLFIPPGTFAPDRLEACRYTAADPGVATAILAVVGSVPERGCGYGHGYSHGHPEIGDNRPMTEFALTERDAALAWARAYNTHDPLVLAPILAADVRVMSRWVVNDLVGRDGYLGYLKSKFATFERNGSVVRVEIGETPGGSAGSSGRPCALMEQDGSLLATVLFDVVGGKLSQISLGPYPSPEECRRSGEVPGFDSGEGIVN